MAKSNLFKLDGRPARFLLHISIYDEGAKKSLKKDIRRHGGVTVEHEIDADVILFNQRRAGWERLAEAYSGSLSPEKRKKWVAPMYFIKYCLNHGTFERPSVKKKRMGGRPPGKKRNPFTAEDEQKLCEYVAIRVPLKEAGGRKGNDLWKSLMSFYENLPEEYEWVKRHTWQSWREHYRKNEKRLDALIEDKVAQQGVDPYATYAFTRYSPDLVKEEEEEEESEEDAGPDLNEYADLEEEMIARRESNTPSSDNGSDNATESDHNPPEEADDIQNFDPLFDGPDPDEDVAHIKVEAVPIEPVRPPSPSLPPASPAGSTTNRVRPPSPTLPTASISPAVSTTYRRRPQASQATLVDTQVSVANSLPKNIYPALPTTSHNRMNTPTPAPIGQEKTPVKQNRTWTTIATMLTPSVWRSKPDPSNLASARSREPEEVISESDDAGEDEEMVDQLNEESQSEMKPAPTAINVESSPSKSVLPPARRQTRSRAPPATAPVVRTAIRTGWMMTSEQSSPFTASKENIKIKEEEDSIGVASKRTIDEDDDVIRAKLQQTLEQKQQSIQKPKYEDLNHLLPRRNRSRATIVRTDSPGYTSNTTVRTPKHVVSLSSGSEDFPLRGTRASDLKKAIVGSSYTPPMGTRAALASGSKRIRLG